MIIVILHPSEEDQRNLSGSLRYLSEQMPKYLKAEIQSGICCPFIGTDTTVFFIWLPW